VTAPAPPSANPGARRAGPFGYAVRAIRRELLGFRFDFDVAPVFDASSLDYHIRSERLFFDAMRLDAHGIPIHWSRTFQSYNPVYIAWYGLSRLQRFLRGTDDGGRESFLQQVAWLESHAVPERDGGALFPLTFDWLEGAAALLAPWPCSMAQGLAISALVRAARLTGREDLLRLALRATLPFERSIDDGGLRTVAGAGALYEEYPARPLPRVLDGFLFSLLGLHDLAEETGSSPVRRLLAEGLDGLEATLPSWDYRGKWSWYGTHGYLCPPHYHNLNVALLDVLGRLTRRSTLVEVAARWSPRRRTIRDRCELYAVFIATKNRSRVRHHLRRRS
jgi:hypothetical protein